MDAKMPKKPKTIAEMLPGLSGIISNDAMQTLTAKKQPRSTKSATRTAEKVLKPMTIAEMRADIQALKIKSPKRLVQGGTSTKKKWNSSVKVTDKTVSRTADGKMKDNPVRKALNFQQPVPPKPKIPKMSNITNARMTIHPETPKLLRSQIRDKKPLYHHARNTVRISGVYRQETPVLMDKPIKNRLTLANKENTSNQGAKKRIAIPKPCNPKQIAHHVHDTPLSNESWKSSCDASFLQYEKDIDFIEGRARALIEESTLENIAEVTPPVSTPFIKYRDVKEFFNTSYNITDNSTSYENNTIMSFDKTVTKENSNREESVIVSLCDMLNKATVAKSNTEATSSELDDLVEVEKQTENNIMMIENGLKTLYNIKESQLKSLMYVRKLIKEKRKVEVSDSDGDNAVIATAKDIPSSQALAKPQPSSIVANPCTIMKSCLKSPSYKIPKKNSSCMRKKVFYKSLPNLSDSETPLNDLGNKALGDRALSMYMKMKEHINYLSTPESKHKPMDIPDTPAVTSYNLQMQLDKLYD